MCNKMVFNKNQFIVILFYLFKQLNVSVNELNKFCKNKVFVSYFFYFLKEYIKKNVKFLWKMVVIMVF